MDSKRKIKGIVAFALAFLILTGMVLTTVLLSVTKKEAWDYSGDDETFNYYSSDFKNKDFDYISNFKYSFKKFFGLLFNDSWQKYVNIESVVEERMELLADKLVTAMSKAKIPSEKINNLAAVIENLSLQNLVDFLTNNAVDYYRKSQLIDFNIDENTEADLEKLFSDNPFGISFYDIAGNLIVDFMNKSALSESEIAKFVYWFLYDSTNDDFKIYIKLIGEDNFEKMISNSIYALFSANKYVSGDSIGVTSRANTIKTFAYQIGSTYTTVFTLLNDTSQFEKMFGVQWTFSEDDVHYKELTRLNENVKGNIGDAFCLFGIFLKNITQYDIENYLNFEKIPTFINNGNDDETVFNREKSDVFINMSIGLAKTLKKSYAYFKNKFCDEDIDDNYLKEKFASAYNSLNRMHILKDFEYGGELFEYDTDDSEDFWTKFYTRYIEYMKLLPDEFPDVPNVEDFDLKRYIYEIFVSCDKLADSEIDIEHIKSLDNNSEEYLTLFNYANSFMYIKEAYENIVEKVLLMEYYTSVLKITSQGLI